MNETKIIKLLKKGLASIEAQISILKQDASGLREQLDRLTGPAPSGVEEKKLSGKVVEAVAIARAKRKKFINNKTLEHAHN